MVRAPVHTYIPPQGYYRNARVTPCAPRQGNSLLKVGDVKEQDADTIVADIDTQDNSLVQRFVVNRHTGFYRPSEK